MNKCKLVGILNVTPDSFSDGGHYLQANDAIHHMHALIEEGADGIDIGAESTRPDAVPIDASEEWKRLAPVLKKLPHDSALEFSLDTRHAETARRALDYGIHCINDVSGFSNASMIEMVARTRCKLVVMHSLTVPASKSVTLPQECDVIAELSTFAQHKINELETHGIAKERIIFDPGIGFGKTATQSWNILENISQLKQIGVPLYVGHSHKSFLNSIDLQKNWILAHAGITKDEATLAVSRHLVLHGVSYLRVHNIAAHRILLNSLSMS